MKWHIMRSLRGGWVVRSGKDSLNSNGYVCRGYLYIFSDTFKAALARDRWKIRQLPQLGTQPPTPWRPPGVKDV